MVVDILAFDNKMGAGAAGATEPAFPMMYFVDPDATEQY
jgi:hypothetical protein